MGDLNRTHAVRRVAVTMNGISVAYLMGFTNAVLAAFVLLSDAA